MLPDTFLPPTGFFEPWRQLANPTVFPPVLSETGVIKEALSNEGRGTMQEEVNSSRNGGLH